MIVEPAHYPTNLEHCRIRAEARNAAEKAWQEIDGGQTYCKDYQLGFKEGFADYLQYGGNGEPPSIPPRQYWKKDSIAGRQLGMEWSAGFRTGAAAAKRTGLRDLIVVPLTGPGISSSHSEQDVLHEPRHETPPVLPISPSV
jgi:hypothetical protein